MSISITLDPSHPVIAEFIGWSQVHPHLVSDAISVGYLTFKHGLLDNISLQNKTTAISDLIRRTEELEQTLQLERAQTQANLAQQLTSALQNHALTSQAEIRAIEARCAADVISAQASAKESAHQELLSLTSQIAELKAAYNHAKAALADTTQSAHASQRIALEKQIEEQRALICQMQKSNMSKGHLGENTVIELLRQCYPKFTHEQTGGGKQAHVCDLHMHLSNNQLIAIECKYKQTITKSDITKFYKDLQTLADTNRGCVAAVFISVMTRNIPTKGNVAFEMVHNTPVLFVGFENIPELERMLPFYMDAILELSRYHEHANTGTTNVADIIKTLTPLTSRIEKMHRRQETMRRSVSEISAAIGDNETDIKELLESLKAVINMEKI